MFHQGWGESAQAGGAAWRTDRTEHVFAQFHGKLALCVSTFLLTSFVVAFALYAVSSFTPSGSRENFLELKNPTRAKSEMHLL